MKRLVKQWYVKMTTDHLSMVAGPFTRQMALQYAKRNGGRVERDKKRASKDKGVE